MEKTATKRFFYIDFLRATAILGVMITHSLALFLGPAGINSTWNYLHFVVVAFVFCSGYVTVYTYKHINNGKSLLTWYKKRFIRLYLPYIFYLLIYTFLAGRSINLNVRYFLDSITLTGGADIGWLTLLFLQFAVLTPILVMISRNRNRLIVGLTLCGLFALMTTVVRIPASYSRAVAWFPWLFIFLLGIYFEQKKLYENTRTRYFFILGIGSFCMWFMFTQILNHLNHPLTLTLHKYPPDIYYFLYGIGINSILLGIVKVWKNPGKHLNSIITFVSKYSYGMFFLHLVILQIITKLFVNIHVIPLTLVSVIGTIGVLWSWNFFFSFAKNYVSSINGKR
jgi:peptidoglycan/LPS O-acetylase OafA/YrhL